ncbi:hypothetical protein GCM10009839_33210 [Catenulispora yoronensis]|uniref:Uncharacterized protein n=2 Tax=Catenulispora yoronensis TaxID=450799 RepID=A0ABP5FRX4_9ACTN
MPRCFGVGHLIGAAVIIPLVVRRLNSGLWSVARGDVGIKGSQPDFTRADSFLRHIRRQMR